MISPLSLTKGLVINYREGGAIKWKIAGAELFAVSPPLKTGLKFSCAPFKEWKLRQPPPPPQYG